MGDIDNEFKYSVYRAPPVCWRLELSDEGNRHRFLPSRSLQASKEMKIQEIEPWEKAKVGKRDGSWVAFR